MAMTIQAKSEDTAISDGAAPRSIWGLASAALPYWASAFGILGVFFGGFCTFLGLSVQAPAIWIIVALFLPLTVVAMLGRMVYLAQAVNLLPRTIRLLPNITGSLLLLSPSNLFGQGVAVSIYVISNGFEILIGTGSVQVVQQDQNIQIKVLSTLPEQAELWQKLATNDVDTLRNTLVRPGHQIERGLSNG